MAAMDVRINEHPLFNNYNILMISIHMNVLMYIPINVNYII